MRFWSGVIWILLLVLTSSATFADEPKNKLSLKEEGFEVDDDSIPEDSDATIHELSETEAWYLIFGIGLGTTSYVGRPKEIAENLKSNGASRRSTLDFDLFNIYIPIWHHHLAIGPAFNYLIDHFTDGIGVVDISQSQYGVSGIYFFDRNIGDGWFTRADIGYATLQTTIEGNNMGSGATDSTQNGIGMILGGGYAWPFGVRGGTRFIIQGNLKIRNYSGTTVPGAALNLALLF